MPRRLDLVGQTFGRLTVLEYAYTEKGNTSWKCKCSCGNEKIILRLNLKRGNTKSCGCSVKNHGLSKHPLYQTVKGSIRRCHNPKQKIYEYYGARGITVWQEWREDISKYIKYIEDNLGEKPTPEHTLDRIDNNGNYEPGNLRWATRTEQNSNRREQPLGISGLRWVRKNRDKWQGTFEYNYQQIYCGYYATPEEAYKAVIQKRIEMNLPIPD